MGRRRTPGLRREEVAQLCGLSATWYTWIEQAYTTRPTLSWHAASRTWVVASMTSRWNWDQRPQSPTLAAQ